MSDQQSGVANTYSSLSCCARSQNRGRFGERRLSTRARYYRVVQYMSTLMPRILCQGRGYPASRALEPWSMASRRE